MMSKAQNNSESGYSIIEVLIGLALGIFLMFGMISLFASIRAVNVEGQALARLQENARFALEAISSDIRMSMHRHCSAFARKAGKPDVIAPPIVRASGAIAGIPGSAAESAAYPLPADYFLRGYECNFTDGDCDPAIPAELSGFLTGHGTDDGDQTFGTDVITIRFMAEGPPIAGDMLDAGGNPDSEVPIPVPANMPDGTDLPFGSGDLVAISDCNNTDFFRITDISGNAVEHAAASNFSAELSKPYLRDEDARLYSLRDITYALEMAEVDGQMVSTLQRIADGNEIEMAQGVERLDIRYAIDRDGDGVSFLTASEVDDKNATDCPATIPGCFWRQVSAIEVSILMTSPEPVNTLGNQPFRYQNTDLTPPNGIPRCQDDAEAMPCTVDRYMRREFRQIISVRNKNA